MQSIAAIIPAWNGALVIGACLRGLRGLPSELVVVDNASRDATLSVVTREAPEARVLRLPENRGFAAACNAGAAATTAPLLLFVNQDAVVFAPALRTLATVFETDPRCAAAGGRLINPDGTLQPSMGPPPHPLRVALDRLPGLNRLLVSHVYRHARWYGKARRPAWLTGACLLVRRSAFRDVGPFDERYFLYTEDLDWCTRARSRGWHLQYLPVTVGQHADEGKRPDRAPTKARLMREGLARYFSAHGRRGKGALYALLRRAERTLSRAPARDETP